MTGRGKHPYVTERNGVFHYRRMAGFSGAVDTRNVHAPGGVIDGKANRDGAPPADDAKAGPYLVPQRAAVGRLGKALAMVDDPAVERVGEVGTCDLGEMIPYGGKVVGRLRREHNHVRRHGSPRAEEPGA